jgi:putative ABC transport system permease protein
VFVPITTAAEITGAVATIYEVDTTDPNEAFIDSVAASLERRLGRYGAVVYANYIDLEANQTQNRLILAIITMLALPVVAIGMVGLANTMTMNVLERTKEIGVLRSLGARRRDVQRLVRAEALTLGLLGWLLAIPLGHGIGRLLIWLLSRTFHFHVRVVMPLWTPPAALVITLVIAVIVTRLPVRRAVNLAPGTALRYE